MKYPSSKVSLVGVFFTASILLIIYLLTIRWHINLPVPIFWLAIGLMLGTIVYQCLQIQLSSSYVNIVLLEIVVTSILLHLVYQIPYYGLFGTDIYHDVIAAKGILSSGFVMGDPQYVVDTSPFPMIHVLGVQLSSSTNLGLFSVAKWFPSLFAVAFIPLLYLLSLLVFKEYKIALLSTLLFAVLHQEVLIGSLFIRETIALVLTVCCIYCYFSVRTSSYPATYAALSIMCLIGVVISHHLTSFMLLVFLAIHFLVVKASELTSVRRISFGEKLTGVSITWSFLLIGMVAILAYWIFVVVGPIYTLGTFVRVLFNPSLWGSFTYAQAAGIGAGVPFQTVRSVILYYGLFFFIITFGVVLFYQLLSRAISRRLEIYSFTLYLFLCGIIGLVMMYVEPIGAGPFPDRFIRFGWLFGLAPLIVAILNGKRRLLRRIGVFLLVAFMLFNVYQIDPRHWNAKAQGVPSAVLEQDYALADTFDFFSGRIAGPMHTNMAIWDVHNILGANAHQSRDVLVLADFDWVIVQKRLLFEELMGYAEPRTKFIADMGRLMRAESMDWKMVYESNNLAVFAPIER